MPTRARTTRSSPLLTAFLPLTARPSPRSVVFRAEIGPLPPRDRSASAPRSVEFRLEIVVCRDIWDSAWRAWVSSVLHMGDWDLCGTRAGFCWNDGIFWRSSYAGIGLPCAMRGVCAHGSRIVAATDVAVPHDYAVPTDTEHPRVCNTHHPRTHAGASRSGLRLSSPTHTNPSPKNHSTRNHHTRRTHPRPPPSQTPRHTTQNRSRREVRPISARVSTDLDAKYDRSRRRAAAKIHQSV